MISGRSQNYWANSFQVGQKPNKKMPIYQAIDHHLGENKKTCEDHHSEPAHARKYIYILKMCMYIC